MAGFIQCNYGGGGGPTIEELWKNTATGVNFANQMLAMDLSAYDYVIIAFKARPANTDVITSDSTHEIFMFNVGMLEATRIYMGTYYRDITAISTGITIATGSAGACIPLKIYGVKGLALSWS